MKLGVQVLLLILCELASRSVIFYVNELLRVCSIAIVAHARNVSRKNDQHDEGNDNNSEPDRNPHLAYFPSSSQPNFSRAFFSVSSLGVLDGGNLSHQ